MADVFEDIFYPGSKRKRNAPAPSSVSLQAPWESKASKKAYTIGGRQVHLYRISALAEALGKSEITIRHWMRAGYFPSDSPIRLSAADPDDDKRRGAHRMFTHEMIKAVVDAFAAHDLLGSARVEWSMHPDLPKEILAAWRRIAKEAFTPAVPAKNN